MSTTTLLYGIFICRRIIHTKWCYATEARSAVPRGFTDWRVMIRITSMRRPTCPSAPPYNAADDLPVRTALQRRGRLARPPSRPVHASAPAYNAEDSLLVRTGSQTPWPVYLSAPTADSPVKDSSFT